MDFMKTCYISVLIASLDLANIHWSLNKHEMSHEAREQILVLQIESFAKLKSTTTLSGGEQKPGYYFWNDSELISTKVCCEIGFKYLAMPCKDLH